LKRLAALDSCAVSDALDSLGIAGVALGLSALSAPRRIVGRAITVQLAPFDGQPARRHLCTAAVEAAGPGSIIVIAHEGRSDVAGWGGLLSLAVHRQGAEGVVIDGAARDVDESRMLDLPVYARAGVPVTARGRVVETDWNLPVAVAGITVHPSDLVIADGSGVVFIPRDRADEVLAAAERIAKRELLMANDVRAGLPISRIMGTSYETMLSGDAE
jgi:regulator of RNase E activity RraA